MMRLPLVPGFLCFAAIVFSSVAAWASPAFPDEVQSVTGAPCPPPCTICHLDMNGGLGTLNPGFGTAMKAAGLTPAQVSTVAPAIHKLEQDKTDTDNDGMPDIEELKQGRDPNVSGAGQLCIGPTYGCGARIEPSGSLDGYAAALALATAAALLARSRRRR